MSGSTFRTRQVSRAALLAFLASCGGGGNSLPSGPSSPGPTSTGPVAVAVVDGDGQPVPEATLRVDGVPRPARVPGGHVFDVERSLAGRPLDVAKDGYLLHETFVPSADRNLDLFAVPADGSKAWIRTLLYDGVISRSGTLARLLQPVSIVRGATLPADTWAAVRDPWERAAERMSDVTGYTFRLADSPLPGSVVYTVGLDPGLDYSGYFEWSGADNVIAEGTIRFRGPEPLGRFSLILHELTHGFGLSHSDRTEDLMHPWAVALQHSERERVVIDSVKRRPPNTAFEDNVRQATRSLGRGDVTRRMFACGTR